MTDGVDLRSLLERVQKAQGPDADLDSFIDESFHGPTNTHCEACGTFSMRFGKQYTSSVDAALSLVSELLPNHVVDIHINHAENYFGAQIVCQEPMTRVTDNSAPSPALSVLICMLQALIAKAEAEEGVGEF